MQIKTTCVRCGKKIGGTGIYCPACESAPTDSDNATSGGNSHRTAIVIGICLLTVLVVAAAVLFTPPHDNSPPLAVDQETPAGAPSLAGDSPQVQPETPEAPALTAQPSASMDSGATAPLTEVEARPDDSPFLHADSPAETTPQEEPGPTTDSIFLYDTAPQTGADDPHVPEADTAAADETPATAPESPAVVDAPEDSSPTEPEPPVAATSEPHADAPRLSEEIWVYYAKEEGKDLLTVRGLQEKDYENVHGKGLWATKYRVNYIFHRDKDGKGLDALAEDLGLTDFRTFHHLDNATSQKLRGLFQDNPELQFLLILQ